MVSLYTLKQRSDSYQNVWGILDTLGIRILQVDSNRIYCIEHDAVHDIRSRYVVGNFAVRKSWGFSRVVCFFTRVKSCAIHRPDLETDEKR